MIRVLPHRLSRLLHQKKTTMKILIQLILLSSLLQGVAQKKTHVLLLGTAHHFKTEFKELQRFDSIQNHLISFEPHIICIESIPVYDTLSIKEVRSRSMRKADSLRQVLSTNKHADPQTVAATRYANYDFWNAYYLWDSLEVKDQSIAPYQDLHSNQSNSEYGTIVFPAARKMGITQFHNIDYRQGEKEFLKNNKKLMWKLLFNLKGFKLLKTYKQLRENTLEAEKKGRLIEYINSPEFQASFSTFMDELPEKWSKSKVARSIKTSWHRRNKIMAERIVDAAMTSKAQRVLVTVGGAHVTHIKLYLEQLGCDVVTYGELINQKQK